MRRIILLISCIVFYYTSFAQDNCASALSITDGATTSVGTINGTADNTCGWTTPGTAGEWYTYTATVDGVINITSDLPQNDGVTNSNDTRLSVYTGSCGSLTCFSGADDISDTNYLTELTIPVSMGTEYFFLWDDRWLPNGFDFTLTETAVSCDDTLPIMEGFGDLNTIIACWETIDNDSDGFGWFNVDYDLSPPPGPDGNPCMGSASWDSNAGALTPDNWLISYAIDLTGLSTSDIIDLTWKARGIDADFADENYTVYVATGNMISDFTSSSVSFNEIIGQNGGAGEIFVDRTLDISSLAGNMVYVAFRHHAVSDQFVLNIDDVAIDFTLGTNDFEKNQLTHFYNKDNDVLQIESSILTLINIEIYNLLGQSVFNKSLSGFSETVNLSSLNDGIYLLRVKAGDGEKTIKLLKQ